MPDHDKEQIEVEAARETSGAAELQLPQNMRLVGRSEYGDLKVYIHQDVYKKIMEFSSSDKTKELGGILAGEYGTVIGSETVLISGYVVAEHTDATAASLTFTHESWEQIHADMERSHKGSRIVGWHHTHPGYGIFLSSYDEFIHKNFFDLKWQIALVVDPKANRMGIFQWKGERLEKLEGWYLYDEPGKALKARTDAFAAKSGAGRPIKKLDVFLIGLVLLLSGALAVAVSGGMTPQPASPSPAATQIQALDALNTRYAALQGMYSDLSGRYDALATLNSQMKSQLNGLPSTFATPAQTPTPAPSAPVEPSSSVEPFVPMQYFVYTVRHGDTLRGICRKFGIEYAKYREIIKALNNLKDENKIITGQKMKLPVLK